MNYEKNNEALAIVRRMVADGQVSQDVAEKYCPELRESEDERIRKELIAFLKENLETGRADETWSMSGLERWIAWIEKQGQTFTKKDVDDAYLKGVCDTKHEFEKQGEKKPADKVEPNFKIGDWIIDVQGVSVNQIIGYEDDSYHIKTSCSKFYLPMKLAEKNYRLWTIKDAKDGDVLLFEGNYNSIALFQGIGINGEGRINYHCKCDLGDYSFGVQGDVACLGTIEKDAKHYHPATKEQRDLLFAKMKEAGYEWDADKKELKEIEQKPIIPKFKVGDVIKDTEDGEVFTIKTITKEKYIYTDGSFDWIKDQDVYELVEWNPRMIIWTGNNLKDVIDFTGKDKNFDKWFKSFEEYEKFVREHEGILKLFNEDGSHYEVPVGAWIVKTPDGRNVASKAVFKQKPAWSEEDDNCLINAINVCEINDYNETAEWLKDLKERVQPQTTWKPSEEHIDWLIWAINRMPDTEKANEAEAVLRDLLEQLKKLRG